ncbi:hypothetical protein CV729_04160 [Helicobacter pylori]|nr:hypothetical protein CV729_04160 [Helicobacter pylori]
MFKRLPLALRKALLSFLDKFSRKLRFFHKFKLFFFFFDLILGVILILFKRKSDESSTKHR